MATKMGNPNPLKICIIIPVHASTRYPGKNEALAPYTLRWLKQVNEDYPNVSVYHAGPCLMEGLYFVDWIPANTGTYKGDVMKVVDEVQADVYVLAQLTQPIREAWLLRAVVGECLMTGLPTVTAYKTRVQPWRSVNVVGQWGDKKTEYRDLYHDGSLYAFTTKGQLDAIFDSKADHAVVLHKKCFGEIDVDEPDDMPHPTVLHCLEELALAESTRNALHK